ncbi:MAG: hypothetical protein MJ178_07250 [Treponemataceae bacterium]|nr:hypothetical protein [Treponemataceae bacterium]
MKNFFYALGVVLLVSVLFMSCASTPKVSSFNIDVQYDSETPAVTLEIRPSWSSNLLYGGGFSGFACTFTNDTDKTVRVVWDQSSLNYNGNSYVPFLEGQKYINAQEPMSPAAISKNSTISKNVFSSNQPYYESGKYGGWRMRPITSTSVELVFCIKTESGEEFIAATVSAVMEQK